MRKLAILAFLFAITASLWGQTAPRHRTTPQKHPTKASATNSGPSLQETLEWLVNTIHTYEGTRTRFDQGDRSEHDVDKTELAVSSQSPCTVEIRRQYTWYDIRTGETSTAARVPLADLDPTSITTKPIQKSSPVEKARMSGDVSYFDVVVGTRNNAPTIHLARHEHDTVNGKVEADQDLLPRDDSKLVFHFVSKDWADRTARALQHAITLCGGKASAF